MMANNDELIFYSNEEPPKMSRSYNILDASWNEIGSVEGDVNEVGEMTSVVKINPEFQKRGIGFKAFQRVFEELNVNVEIQKIIGSWLFSEEEFPHCEGAKSSNLTTFWECMKDEDDAEKCCFQTPTGKWAKNLSFNKCHVVRQSDKTVTVEFMK